MRSKIEYAGREFQTADIKSVNMRLAASLLSRKLEANTITAVVKSEDTGLRLFIRNTPLRYYYRDRQRFLAYVQSVDRIGPNKYQISGTSAIGLLIERMHTGGIYTGQTAEAVIREIVGAIPFTITGGLKGVKLYGWLPYAKPPERSARDNLVQVLFALGAAIKTDLDGVLRIEPLWNGESGSIGWYKIFKGAKAPYDSAVSAVSVAEHHYMVGGDEETLFEGDALSGDIITFSEPMYGLSATGFTILESNANYAKLSTGNGTLTGHKYIHNTRQITRTVTAGVPENVQTINDATLVSLVNSNAVAERMADYYKHTGTIKCDAVVEHQSPGDVLSVYHPYDKTVGPACLESLDITASGIMRASLTALVGYKPKQAEQTVTYDQHQIITSSGTVTLPDGVTSVRVVLIGGGSGGSGGNKGSSGTAGSGASNSGNGTWNTNPSIGQAGRGGAGGDPGSGGSGGKVASFEITGDAIKTLSVSIGTGGPGGAANGGAGSSGGNTTLTVNGVTYSSASGAPGSYQDLVTGTVYGGSGNSGNSGAAGGDGSTPWGTPDDYYTEFQGSRGSNAGSNQGGTGGYGGYYGSGYVASCAGGGGGGGAAYNAPGGSGSTAGGRTGGAGGKGASGTKPSAASTPGKGGTGGNGGGGGGGGGGTIAAAMQSGSITTTGGSAGQGGDGGQGGNGAAGCVILYYGVPQKLKSGSPISKDNQFFLDKFGRLLVV